MFQMVGEIVKGALGVVQMVQGQEGLAGLERPKYERPSEISQMVGLDRQEYGDPTFPGQSSAQDRLDMSASAGFNQAMASGNTLASLAALQAQNQAGQINLSNAAASHQAQQLAAYKNSLGIAAKFADQEFQMNEFAPYADKAQKYENMIGAGTKNLYGSLSGLGGIGDAMASNALANSNGGQDATTDTSDIYAQYNSGGGGESEITAQDIQAYTNKGDFSGANIDFISNMTNPHANMPGYTWDASAGRWVL
jgi:hypothetical protein